MALTCLIPYDDTCQTLPDLEDYGRLCLSARDSQGQSSLLWMTVLCSSIAECASHQEKPVRKSFCELYVEQARQCALQWCITRWGSVYNRSIRFEISGDGRHLLCLRCLSVPKTCYCTACFGRHCRPAPMDGFGDMKRVPAFMYRTLRHSVDTVEQQHQ